MAMRRTAQNRGANAGDSAAAAALPLLTAHSQHESHPAAGAASPLSFCFAVLVQWLHLLIATDSAQLCGIPFCKAKNLSLRTGRIVTEPASLWKRITRLIPDLGFPPALCWGFGQLGALCSCWGEQRAQQGPPGAVLTLQSRCLQRAQLFIQLQPLSSLLQGETPNKAQLLSAPSKKCRDPKLRLF